MTTTDKLTAAYGRLVTALEEAATDQDLNQRAHEAYNAYAALLADVSNEPAVAEVTQAFDRYRMVISGGFQGPQAGDQIRAAYQNYLAEVRAAWAETDSTAIAPADLATIGQSLAHLAWLVETSLHGTGTEPEKAGNDRTSGPQEGVLWGPTSRLAG